MVNRAASFPSDRDEPWFQGNGMPGSTRGRGDGVGEVGEATGLGEVTGVGEVTGLPR